MQSTSNVQKTHRGNYSNFKTKYAYMPIFMNQNDNFD